MKQLIIAFIASIFVFQGLAVDLEYVRSNFGKAVTDEKLCKELMSELAKDTESNVHLGYLGAFQTIWANHVSNPLSKLRTFNQGKKNIEQAIKADPDNVELRFIRLSVQKNAPIPIRLQCDDCPRHRIFEGISKQNLFADVKEERGGTLERMNVEMWAGYEERIKHIKEEKQCTSI